MLDGVKTQKEISTKPVQQDWNGICKVCGKQTQAVKIKHLNTDLYTIDMIYTECGHHFLENPIWKDGVIQDG